jgi:transposase
MTELTRQQKKELAQTLFLNTALTQQEIADQVGVDRRTITRWVKEWEPLKINYIQTREARIRSTLMQLEQLDHTIDSRDDGCRYPSAKEADIRRKLTADLEALEQDASVREVINVSRSILDYVRQLNLEHAKLLSDYLDSFIKEKIKWAK